MSWSLVSDTVFSGLSNASAGSAGATLGTTGFIDVHGGIWSINSGLLVGTSDGTDNNQWSRDFLIRPASENHRDQRIVFFIPGASAGGDYWCALRYNNSGTPTNYLIHFGYNGGSLKVEYYAANGSSPTQIGSTVNFSGTASHNISVDISAVGASPTTLTVTVTDLTSSTVLYTGSQTDSTAALQVAGQMGLTASNGTTSIPNPTYYSEVATYQQVTATLSVSPTNLTAGTTGNALTLTGSGTSWTAGSPGSPTFTASSGTIASQVVSSATAASLIYTAPSTAGTVTITDPSTGQTVSVTISLAAATNFTLTPGSLTTTPGVATSNYTVALNGALSSNETITLSDGGAGGTFTPSSLTFTSSNYATPQAFTYTPASGTGGTTKTLMATGSGNFPATHTASCVVSAGPTVIPVTDANWFWSPYNWYQGASYAAAAAPGAYFKVGFTGTSATLNVQVSQIPGTTPKVRWSIDGGAYVVQQLSGTTLALASGLASGNHTLELYLMATQGGSGWSSLTNVLWVTGLQIDAGATTVAQTVHTKRVIINGDSITQGVSSTGSLTEGVVGDDSLLTYAAHLGVGLGAEYGQLGYTGLGWTIAAAGGAGAPAFFTPGNDSNSSWNKYYAGASRLSGGLYSPAPDYIFTLLGRNDYNQSGSGVTAAVSGWLTAARAAAPSAWIFVVIPFDGSCRSVITTGFNNYQTATPDTKAVLLDLHTDAEFNLTLSTGGTTATAGSADGTHPNYQLHGVLGAALAKAAQVAIGGGTTVSGYSRSRIVNKR